MVLSLEQVLLVINELARCPATLFSATGLDVPVGRKFVVCWARFEGDAKGLFWQTAAYLFEMFSFNK